MKPYQLDERHRLIHDGHSYVIQEWIEFTKPSAKSSGRWRAIGYYTSIQSLLKAFVDVQVGKSKRGLIPARQQAVTQVSTLSAEICRALYSANYRPEAPAAETGNEGPVKTTIPAARDTPEVH